jgi:predicted nucleotidyltransferase
VIPALSTHRADIDALCRRFHVRRLDVFGSAACGDDFTPRSDIDLLVDFEPAYGTPALGEFFGLRDALAALLGHDVDLTMTGAIRNPFLRNSIERSRVALHGV